MVGIADKALWSTTGKSFDEIAPTSVKKIITGSGKATKDEVAMALEHYVGKHDYATDDESDAVAVGVAWMIQNGLISDQTINDESNHKEK